MSKISNLAIDKEQRDYEFEYSEFISQHDCNLPDGCDCQRPKVIKREIERHNELFNFITKK